MVETWNDVFGEGDEENKQRGNTAFACFAHTKEDFFTYGTSLKIRGG